MAVVYIPFQPQRNVAPPFQQTINMDGAAYNLVCTWNSYRGGYYVSLVDQYGTTVWYGALVGSPLTANIYLAPGIFTTSTLLYRSDTNNFEVGP